MLRGRITGFRCDSALARADLAPPRGASQPERFMAKRKKKAAKKKTRRATKARGRGTKRGAADFIISKARTKAAAGINVSGEFYAALDETVRNLINGAEERAISNGRKTLRPHDL